MPGFVESADLEELQMMNVHAEAELERAIQDAHMGGERELGTLLDHYRPMLLRMAKQRLGPALRVRISGSDLVQETLLSATRNFQAFRGNSARQLQGWMLRILKARLTDGLRRHWVAERRRLSGPSNHGYTSSRPALLDGSASPSKIAVLREQSTALWKALAELDEQDRQVLVLRYVEQLGFEEIAARMQLPLSSVWRRWRKTVESLKSRLEDEGF